MAKGLERQPRGEGRARLCAEQRLHGRHQAADRFFASGAGPDLFIISPGDFLRYYNGGVLLDLTPFIEPRRRRIFRGVIANRMVDGKIYGLPMEVEPMAMYY